MYFRTSSDYCEVIFVLVGRQTDFSEFVFQPKTVETQRVKVLEKEITRILSSRYILSSVSRRINKLCRVTECSLMAILSLTLDTAVYRVGTEYSN